MNKIIAAFDGLNFSRGTLDYCIYLAKHSKSEILAVFLDDPEHHSYNLTEVFNAEGYISEQRLEQLNREDLKTRNSSVHLFEDACISARLDYSIHRDKNLALHELLHESIYCDLLVIDKKEDFSRPGTEVPTNFLQNLLAAAHCPVLIVPGRFKKIEEAVLLYDGRPSSVNAIKMFSYLLPMFENKNVEVITVKNEEATLHIPDGKLMREFLNRRYPLADFILEKGDVKEELSAYLEPKEHAIVVLGAYGRGVVSRLLKHSLADFLIKELDLPVFVAH